MKKTKNNQSTDPEEQNKCLQKTIACLIQEVEAQKALAESRDRYRLYSEVSTEGILFHKNGVAIDVNDTFTSLVECPRDQIIGMDIIEKFVSPADAYRVKKNMVDNNEFVSEIVVHSAAGRIFPVEIRSKFGELAGRPCSVVIIRDITNRKEAERQLIQSQKMEAVGTLAGGIAHDFNNMLAGIQGNVDILQHQLPPDSLHHKRLDSISQIVDRGAKLTRQLLGYARGGQTDICKIKLSELVEDALEMFGQSHRHIVIETRFHAKTPTVNGDRTQIEQVLLNLIINAVHAMHGGGHLFIETTPTQLKGDENRPYEIIPGPYAMLTVRDTGHGMDEGTQKHIFDPFFTTKEEGQGTGLGLASTYGIVKNHKGYIDVFSKPGHGAKFNVLLPASGSAKDQKPIIQAA